MKVDIHATIGPASWKSERFRALLSSGIYGVRINMSHMNHGELPGLIEEMRDTAPHVFIGADIRGRKLRIGPLPGGEIFLKSGETFLLLPMEDERMGSHVHTTVNYPSMADSVKPGVEIVLDDGALSLRVNDVFRSEIVCTVERGGQLLERAGINIPGHTIHLPALTPKDYQDLDLLSNLSIDIVYLSFVESGRDIHLLRSALKERRMNPRLIAKIELSMALKNLEEILEESDGICLARGDLGVEVPLAEIPYVQRSVVESAQRISKPIILAGEVLYSLVQRTIPFRAELTDTVTAVEQGVNGFILSDETAIGVDPVNAVQVLQELIREAQKRSSGHEGDEL